MLLEFTSALSYRDVCHNNTNEMHVVDFSMLTCFYHPFLPATQKREVCNNLC